MKTVENSYALASSVRDLNCRGIHLRWSFSLSLFDQRGSSAESNLQFDPFPAISHFQSIDLNRPDSTMSPNPWQHHCATITGLSRRQLGSLLPTVKSSVRICD